MHYFVSSRSGQLIIEFEVYFLYLVGAYLMCFYIKKNYLVMTEWKKHTKDLDLNIN